MPLMTQNKCRAQHYNLWMIEPTWFTTAVEQVRSGVIRAMEDDEEVLDSPDYELINGVAVIEINGPIMKGRSKFGGTSSLDVRSAVRKAAKDESVKAIMLHIDSPGGTAAGTAELAADIGAADSIKPVHSHIEDLGASAAYWIASQARRISATNTSEVGSIGTVMQLADTSDNYEQQGIKVYTLSTGAFKGAGFDGNKITPDQLDYFQERVDDLNRHFINGVKSGRKMPIDDVRKAADGRVFGSSAAMEMKLIDAVQSFDDAMAELDQEVKSIDLENAKSLVANSQTKNDVEIVVKSFGRRESVLSALRQRHGLGHEANVSVCGCSLEYVKSADIADPHGFRVRITTDSLDRDREVMIPQGMVSTDFEKVGAIFWNHVYDMPVAKPGKLFRSARSVDNEGMFAVRPPDYQGDFFPDFVRAMVQQEIVKGASVGFLPIETRNPTKKDIEQYGENVRRVHSRWRLLEWSFAPIQSNIESVVIEAARRGILSAESASAWFGVMIPMDCNLPQKPKKLVYVIDNPCRIDQSTAIEDVVKSQIQKARGRLYLI